MAETANKLVIALKAKENPRQALLLQGFFKTGPGEYGAGDRFLGLKVPQTRAIAKDFTDELDANDLSQLLSNKWHEVRQAALFVMVSQYKKGNKNIQQQLYDLYIKNIGKGINNWDLVDVTCPRIVGIYLLNKDRKPLYDLAKGDLWQKRVSIISTFWFLREGEPGDIYALAEILVYEKHDLLQKAVGWALREMGKLDDSLLEQFLNKYATSMPRTALRYALEKMPLAKKQHYMNLKSATI
jgi:3-methyladenine DNA glycosylase AlkD